jgi:hypothetical protein
MVMRGVNAVPSIQMLIFHWREVWFPTADPRGLDEVFANDGLRPTSVRSLKLDNPLLLRGVVDS